MATDSFEGQLGVPSRPLSDDCVDLADGHGTSLSKGLMTTMCNDVADLDSPSSMLPGGSDVAAARGGFLLGKPMGDRREQAPLPLSRRWPCCFWRWLLCCRWRFQESPPPIDVPAISFGSREPPNEPGGGGLVNGDWKASMAPLAGPLESSWKPHYQRPRPSFWRHGGAAHDHYLCRRRKVATRGQLPATSNCTGYTRGCQGQIKTEIINLRPQREQRIPL